jgi:hypothetical protein
MKDAMSIPDAFEPSADLLAGRTVMITGATGGLGRALSIACARAGASVILAGRNGTKLDRLYDEIEALGSRPPPLSTSQPRRPRITTAWLKPSGRSSASSTDWCMRPPCSAIALPSSNTTCPPGAGFCTSI